MRVAVTGAGGFVGHAVTAALTAAGHDVVALTRASPVRIDGVEVRVADLADLGTALDDVDAVCHLAAAARVRDSITDPWATWRTNVGGTLAVLDALHRAGRPARLVLASTCAVHGEGDVDEDSPLAPATPYAASKLAADLAARDLAATGAIGAVSLRPGNVAGAVDGRGDTDPTRLVPALLDVAAGARPEFVVNGDGSAVRDLVHVADVADAFVAALDVGEPGRWRAFVLGSGRPVSVGEIVETARRVTGRALPVRHREAAAEPSALVADATRARAALGWTARRSTPDAIVTDAWSALGP